MIYLMFMIRTCRNKTPLFRNRYQPDMHYIVPVNSAILLWKILKHQKGKLERYVYKIRQVSQTGHHLLRRVVINGVGRHPHVCVWDHICHLRCSMLTSRENIPVQMQIMSEYIFLYDPLLNCLWQPPSDMWFDRLMDQQHWKRLVIICQLLPIIKTCLRLTIVFGWNTI